MQKIFELFERKIINQNKRIESLTKEKNSDIYIEKEKKDNDKNLDDSSS